MTARSSLALVVISCSVTHAVGQSPVPTASDLFLIRDAESRSISPENLTGAKGGGSPVELEEGNARRAARHLGRGWKVNPFVVIPPGATFTMGAAEGPGIVNHVWLTMAGAATNRDAILRIYWDDEETPSVETPVGCFFASGWGRDATPRIASSTVSVLSRNGFNSFWQMPFRGRFRVTMENRGGGELKVYYQIDYTLCDVPAEAGYFHAQYRQARPVPAGEVYTILDGVAGRGQYVGTYLGRAALSSGWWGEGEVKFYLDGDGEFPTINYTGEEDYFLGSYCYRDPDFSYARAGREGRYGDYTSPYAGFYAVADPETRSRLLTNELAERRFGQYRWHVVDPIRFGSDLRVTVQSLGWAGNRSYGLREDDVFSVAYWYQTEPHAPFPPLPSPEEIRIPPLKRGVAPRPIDPSTIDVVTKAGADSQ